MTLSVGASTGLARFFSRSGANLIFQYFVQVGDTDTDGISILANALALNAGSGSGLSGMDASPDLDSHVIANDPMHKVDGSKVVPPEATGARITSRPQDGVAYGAGEEIDLRIGFSH